MREQIDILSYLFQRKQLISDVKDSLPSSVIFGVPFFEIFVKGKKIYVTLEQNVDKKLISYLLKHHKEKEFVFL